MSQFVFEPHNLHGETIDGEAMPFGYISQIQESGHRLPVFELNTVFGDMPGLDLAGIARAMAAAPAMAAMLRGIDRDDDGDAMLDASGMDEIAAILSRIDGATPTDEREPAQNGPDGHCLHCGRDNRGHEGEPCADDCPQYHEAKGLAAPTDEPATPTGEDAHRFTVIWGNIGDDDGKRLDHVTVKDATHSAIMDAAFACFFADLEAAGEILSESDRDEFRNHTAYDGFAILPGHVTDAPGLGF